MSGIVGTLNIDGAPVEARLLRRLTDFLTFRGPDAQQTWIDRNIGFGHTLLRTTPESALERQPLSLNGQSWIVADARIDGRAALIASLEDQGHHGLADASDAELILRSHQLWGEDCVDRLLGDFCFAIWDARRQRLFCARDQMGVKPFFYAKLGTHLIFSNTLDCLREHPSVSGDLNDLAIADFLLHDMGQDPTATVFAGLRRLPPAHILTCESGDISVRRYWKLSAVTSVSYGRGQECVEQFRELLDTAVGDRLRGESAGVFMSGGLDSPTVAASAQRVLSRSGNNSGVRAYTLVFDRLIPDQERYYSGVVAKALGIPIEFRAEDDMKIFDGAEAPAFRTPEPAHCAVPTRSADQLAEVAPHSRVAFTGTGADPGFSSRVTVYFRRLLKERRFGRAIGDAARYLMSENRLERLYIRTRLRILLASKHQFPSYPEWLDGSLEKRLALRDRWEASHDAAVPDGAERPEAYEALGAAVWADTFEAYDPGVTRVPVEVRHPFFDLRLLNFLLSLPALPWCSDKQLLREAARGVLPEEIRLRRKAPLAGDPLVALLKQPESAWVDRFEPAPELSNYVVRDRIPRVSGEQDPWRAWIHLRPLSLNFWLRQLGASRRNGALIQHQDQANERTCGEVVRHG